MIHKKRGCNDAAPKEIFIIKKDEFSQMILIIQNHNNLHCIHNSRR
jgi:hypothetical protein